MFASWKSRSLPVANLMRVAFMALAFIGVALAAAAQQPEWARDLQVDSSCALTPPAILPPDESQQAVHRRIRQKEQVTVELLDGRLTLFEAAAIFLRLNQEYPPSTGAILSDDLSLEEYTCKQVIKWAYQVAGERSPELAVSVTARFEEELRRHKEQYHTVNLQAALSSEEPAARVPATE
jgi:glutathione S-transferase